MVSSKKKSIVMSPIRRRMEKTQPIQWTERPTGALVAVNSLWPSTGGEYWLTWDVDAAWLGFCVKAEILLSKLWIKPEGGEAEEEEEEEGA